MARGVAWASCLWLLWSAAPLHAQLLSPGALAKAHQELDSDDDCARCHQGGRGVRTQLCTECHDDIGRQLSQRKGLHGTRFSDDSCGHCHVEHRGAEHQLIRWPGGSREHFQHEITGFELSGGHAGVACRDCHGARNRRGAPSHLGLKPDCAGCHREQDVHEGRFGTRCASCHGTTAWGRARLDAFDHARARFALEGAHREVECARCHFSPPRYRGLKFDSCSDCHSDPHGGRLGGACESCHEPRGWDRITMKRSAHPGLRITAGHARIACNDCHDAGLLAAPTRGERCVSCHRPVHEARFGTSCERCHREIRWLGLPERIGRKAHGATPFPLLGAHEAVDCEGCHRKTLSREERYRGLSFERCDDCHRDAHGGKLSRFGDGDCQGCHDVHGFRPTVFSIEQHVDTSFPLLGKHVAVACGSCHRIEVPRLDWTVERQACADCHDNPHGDQFAREMAQGGCASCHSPVAWNAPNIDHSTWPLTGAHEQTPCASCHAPSEADRLRGSGASYRGVPRECDGCHGDPHLGQFRLSEPVRACDHCHETRQFQISTFDHATLADYPLEGAHAAAQCEACHRVETLRNDAEARRYRLGYRDCADCHADPHADGHTRGAR